MGLIENILLGVIYLALIMIDVLFILIVLNILYNHWHIHWMKPILIGFRPLMITVLNWFHPLVSRITGKSYPEKTLLVLLAVCLTILRFLIVSLFS